MATPIVAVVLICSASIAVQDCSVDNATDITYGESASTVYECLASGQALIASTALGPGLGKDQYLKIICADPNHIPSAAKPSTEHIAREQP
jgi:hypothetical protein